MDKAIIILIIVVIIFIVTISIALNVINEERSISRAVNMHFLMIEILDTRPDMENIEKYLNKILKNRRLTLSKKKVKEGHEIILDIIKDLIEENKVTSDYSAIPVKIKEDIYQQLKKLHKDEKL